MRIFLVGASGRTGRLVVEKALGSGHTVTALVRDDRALAAVAGLKILKGNALSSGELKFAIRDHDLVISVLGRRTKADGTLLQDAARAMLAALPVAGVNRYIVVSQGLLFPSANPLIALLRLILATAIADSTAMERLVQASEIQWTIVRPPRLKDGAGAHAYRACVGARPKGALSMQRGDLASFLVDEAEQSRYRRAIVGVG